jgi:hypothetical protein
MAEALKAFLGHPDPKFRTLAGSALIHFEALAPFSRREVMEEVLTKFKLDQAPGVRALAVEALVVLSSLKEGAVSRELILEGWRWALGEGSIEVRRKVAPALGFCPVREPLFFDAVESFLGDPDLFFRQAALGLMADPATSDEGFRLRTSLKEKVWRVLDDPQAMSLAPQVCQALMSLGLVGPSGLQHIERVMDRAPMGGPLEALMGFMAAQGQEALPFFRRALGQARFRKGVMDVLSRMDRLAAQALLPEIRKLQSGGDAVLSSLARLAILRFSEDPAELGQNLRESGAERLPALQSLAGRPSLPEGFFPFLEDWARNPALSPIERSHLLIPLALSGPAALATILALATERDAVNEDLLRKAFSALGVQAVPAIRFIEERIARSESAEAARCWREVRVAVLGEEKAWGFLEGGDPAAQDDVRRAIAKGVFRPSRGFLEKMKAKEDKGGQDVPRQGGK